MKHSPLSYHSKFAASVALRSMISRNWESRRNCQRLGIMSNYWSKEIRTNIAAYREINSM
jgi:hypothetical protein